MIRGIDFSQPGLKAAEVKAHGYHFVCRYLSGGFAKDITAPELEDDLKNGVPVVFVWEVFGQEMNENQGIVDAQNAEAELDSLAKALGGLEILKNAVVFFAQDLPEAPGIDPIGYMRGVNKVIGKARSAAYGPYAVIKELFDAGLISFGWQTSGGSGGLWDARALLRQVAYDVDVNGTPCDVDLAAFWASKKILTLKDNFGQFPTPPGTRKIVEYITTGTECFREICDAHGDTMARVYLRTLKHGPHPRLVAYAALHLAGRYRMPKGIHLYLAE